MVEGARGLARFSRSLGAHLAARCLDPIRPSAAGSSATSRNARDETGYAFYVFRKTDDALLGGVTLSQLRRGVTQSCSLGYWIGEPFARKGYMTAGLAALVGFIFDEVHLHRIEAACVPTNLASKALLLRTGFTLEGYARQYLCINGIWRDHLLFAMLASDPRPDGS